MVIGPVETVRIFTKNLADSRRFYADVLGLKELVANDRWAIFETGQAKLLVERVDDEDPDGNDGRRHGEDPGVSEGSANRLAWPAGAPGLGWHPRLSQGSGRHHLDLGAIPGFNTHLG
jgi:catechol 2,3-dioxygenase-like lactoylglutathione lyase family enzyme